MEGTQTWQEAIGRVQDLLGTKYSEVPAALRARASGQLQLHQMLALSVRDPPVKFYAYTEPKYFGELITANNVGTTLLRSVLLAAVTEAERMEQAKLAREQGQPDGVQYSQHTKGGNLKAIVRGGRILVKDIGAQVLKKFLEIRALHLLPAKWAAKLVKNVSKSALRKVARVGTARAAMQMFFTTLRANVLTVINSVCVEAVVEIVRVCWPKKQADEPRTAHVGVSPRGQRAVDVGVSPRGRIGASLAGRQVAKLAARTIVRHTAVIILTSLGGALGTFVWPGKGTMIGELLGAQAGVGLGNEIVEAYLGSHTQTRGLALPQ